MEIEFYPNYSKKLETKPFKFSISCNKDYFKLLELINLYKNHIGIVVVTEMGSYLYEIHSFRDVIPAIHNIYILSDEDSGESWTD